MTRINTNLTSLQAQNNLYNNESSLQTSLQRLSTGLRINSGKDDPSGLIAASVLGSEVVGINQAITNSQRANNIVATADAALSQVSTLLNNIAGLVQASANKGAISASEIAANQVQVDSAIDSIDRIGQTTVFGGDQLLNGSKSFNVTGSLGSVFQSTSNIQVNSANPNSNVALQVTTTATQKTTNIVGDSQGTAGVGLSNLSLDSGTTRATSTLATNDFTLGATSLNGLSTSSTRATQTINGADIAALSGGANDTLTLHVTGNLGNADVTVKVADATTGIKTNDQNLIDAINGVSDQTGVVASGNGGNADVTLKSTFVGSSATVGITATAGTNAGSYSKLAITNGDINFVGTGPGSLNFTINGVDSSGNAKSVNVSLDASTVKTAANFANAVNTAIAGTGLQINASNTGSELDFTSTTLSATPITITNISATGAGDAGLLTTATTTGATSTNGTAADMAAFNAAVGTATDGISGQYTNQTISAATLKSLGSGTIDLTITGSAAYTFTGQALTGAGGISDATSLAALINTKKTQTGVQAVVNGGNVVISSTTAGSAGVATASFGNFTGSDSSLSFDASSFGSLVTDAALKFTIHGVDTTGAAASDAITLSAPAGGYTAATFAAALTGALSNVDATVTSSGNTVTITSSKVGATPITIDTFSDSGTGDSNVIKTSVSNGTSVTGAAAVVGTDAALNTAAVSAQTNGAIDSTQFTITGNKGSATISTAALGGNDSIINNDATNAGVTALTNYINNFEGTTGITASVNSSGNVVLTSDGAGSASIAKVTATGSGNDATIVSAGHALTTTAGADGTSNQVTLQLIGDKGRAVITVSNNDVINNSASLVSAINAVTTQTGITASGSGAGGNVTLTSADYGSAAQLSISAIAATNSNDITLFNANTTQQTTAGKDVSGTITTGNGSSQFTGQGAAINYSDSSINFTATTTPSLAAPTAATTTIVGNGGTGAGLNHLTAGSSDTNVISFTVTGTSGATATISGINVAQLQGDSRVLVNAINKVSAQTGVVASTQAGGGGSYALSNIVLTSTAPGTGSVSIQANTTGTTVAADQGTFNNAGTFTGTAAGTAAPISAAAAFNVSGGALFQIGPQVNLTNQVNVNITNLDTHLLGQSVGTTGSLSLHDLRTGGSQVLSGSDLTNASLVVQQAISQIATLRGQLGALQANVLESNISSQQTALEQVTSAQSSIQDADFATETANLTRAQVLVQAGTSVLAIANQQPQSVLALLPRS